MEYRRFQDTIIVRMDKGEEILEQLKVVSEKEQVKLASVSALGAINDFTVGVFHTDEKKYYSNSFQGSFEIVSLTGTVSTKDGEFYVHIQHERRGRQRSGIRRPSEPGHSQRHLRNGRPCDSRRCGTSL